MIKLSSPYTRFLKVVFPAYWFGFLTLDVAIGAFTGDPEIVPMVVVTPLAMAAFGFAFFKRRLWDLVDEVHDCGDSLLIRDRGCEERIPLSNVMNVSVSGLMSLSRASLTLAVPGVFGNEVAFCPARRLSFNPFARIESLERLIVRVDEARSRRAI